ncbi:MAG: hypothetical protein CMA53_00005 [Euryarchaeota archaeon]|nr:hypothetical protein [Euryarchaeota archaeon]
MVRLLSVLPGFVGLLCVILLLGSLRGIDLPSERSVIDMVPCEFEDPDLCLIAMTPEISPPTIFGILDIDLQISWQEADDAWFAVVNSDAAEICPPDEESWLTECTVEDVENYIIIGGPNELDGQMTWNIKTDDYRIITGGREGADIGDQQALTTSTQISLNWFVEFILALVSLTLFLGAGEMAFPIKKFFLKFRES